MVRIFAHPVTHGLLGLGIFLLDAFTSPFLTFPILFIVPVCLASWFHGWWWGVSLAILLPIGRAALAISYENPHPAPYVFMNAGIRISVLLLITYLVSRTARQTRELEKEVKMLEGILPICMHCKRIRDNRHQWQRLETYISEHSQAGFSHGLCPECARQFYGDILADKP
jgi:hypothetical protein